MSRVITYQFPIEYKEGKDERQPMMRHPKQKRRFKTSSNLDVDANVIVGLNTKKKKKKKKHRDSRTKDKYLCTGTSNMGSLRHLSRNVASDEEDEPIGMSSGLNAKRTSLEDDSDGVASTAKDDVPRLYKEDLGVAGVKRKAAEYCSIEKSTFSVPVTGHEERRRKERQMRFSSGNQAFAKASVNDPTLEAVFSALSSSRESFNNDKSKKKTKKRKKAPLDEDDSLAKGGFVGSCENLEKPYLRLTTFPKPEDVRPLSVLKKSLAFIKKRYMESEDFDWANEQLKSVRQDLTVQGIKNEFVLEVYETHARIVLEQGSLNEFNQCQTMIKSLTLGMRGEGGVSGDGMDCVDPRTPMQNRVDRANRLLVQTEHAADEFGAYRLLYALVQKEWGDVTKELIYASANMHTAHKDITKDPRAHRMSSCEHAVLVTKAITHHDYHAFFRLYDSAPNLSAYLMDFLVQRVRTSGYERIIAAYRPTVSVEFFREALFFRDLEETRQFLKQSGAVFVLENGAPPFWIDCKASK